MLTFPGYRRTGNGTGGCASTLADRGIHVPRGGMQRQPGSLTVGCASRPNTCRWIGLSRTGRVAGGRVSAFQFATDVICLESNLVMGLPWN
ncbi:hypothetical protein B296_00032971 [Ensete ventricosum]|uniref:Uncharacterized protein n=1 Tax=Ensete ventricosum TaxID=4639 RepID=A0A426YDA4_ENSVE|nr:hypothetical protein B296_00032971 [Ensete ventricosum]